MPPHRSNIATLFVLAFCLSFLVVLTSPWALVVRAAPIPQAPTFQANINKSFSPIAISAGGVSTLSVTIYNPNPFALTLSSLPAAWTDTLPVGMTFAAPANPTSTCGGMVTASGTTLALFGGTVPAQVGAVPGSCTVSVSVTSSTAGNLINTIPAGALHATDPSGAIQLTNPTAASATLQVNAVQPPSLSMAYAPNTIWVGQTSVLTITIRNNDANTALTDVLLSNTLPDNVIVASPANATNTCGGSVTAAGGTVALTSGAIPRSGTCSFAVNVTSTTPGIYTDPIPAGAIQDHQGVTNASAASAPLNVQSIGLSKSFSPANFQTGGSSTLTITLQNPSGSPYTGATFTDNLPAGVAIATPADAATTCPDGQVTTTATSVRLSGATVPAGTLSAPGSCQVTVRVTSGTAASYTNRILAGALITDQGASNVLPATANLSVYAGGGGLTGSKAFYPNPVAVDSPARLTINIVAPADTALTDFSITDALPAGLRVADPPNASLTATCGTAPFTPAAGDTLVSYSGGTIPAGATCTLRIYVTGSQPGVYTNTISSANITNAEKRNLTANFSASLTVGGMTVAKSFSPTAVNPDGISTLTITLTNNNYVQLDDVSLTDTLPGALDQGLVIAADPRASTTCTGGVITAEPGTQTIGLSGGTIPARVGTVPGICTILVDVVGKGTAATHTNRILVGAVSGTLHGTTTHLTNLQAPSANLVVQPIAIDVVKGFSPLTVFAGSASTLTINLSNPSTAQLTGIAFTDDLPQRPPDGGMTIANPPNLSTGTCGGVLDAVPGATSFSYSGGSLAANASCTLTLNVAMNVENNLTNTLPEGAVTTTNGATNAQAASATLTNLPGASVSKAFGPNPIVAGAGNFSTLSITVQNVSNFPITGVGLVDVLPDGLTAAAPASPQCGGAVTSATDRVTLTGGSLPAYSACTIQVPVSAVAAGSYKNCLPVGVLVTDQGATNQTEACDTLQVNAPLTPPTIRKIFSPNPIAAGRTSALTFTLTNTNSVALTGVSFTDTFPAGMTLSSIPNAAQCGGLVSRLAADSIALTDGVIQPNRSCTVVVSVTAAEGGTYPNTSSTVTSANAPEGGRASRTLTVIAPPSIAKTFNPAAIVAGGRSTLNFEIRNPNPAAVLTGVAFSDALPSGMRVADPPQASLTGCGTSSTPVFAPAAGDTTLSFSAGSIAAGGVCLVSVDVTANGGTYVNTTSAVASANGGNGAPASATLTTAGAGLSLLKTTTATSFLAAGDSLPYTYTLTNTGDVPLYPPFQVQDDRIGLVAACDPLLSLDPGQSLTCSASDTVLAADVDAGRVTNRAVASALDAEIGGAPVTSNQSSVTVRLAALTIIKRTTTASYRRAGNTLTYTYTLANTGGVPLYGAGPAGEFMVSDDRLGAPLGAPFACDPTIHVLAPGANLICTGTHRYTVTAADVSAGSVTNTAFASATDQDGAGSLVTSNTAGVTVYLVVPPLISKAFSPASIPVGDVSTLTFTITSPDGNTVPLAGVSFSDVLPSGLTVAQAPDAAQCGGTVSYDDATNTLTLTGGTVLPGSDCTVTVSVTAATSGSYPNTSRAVASTNGGTGLPSNTATLLVVAPPLIQKSFNPTSVLSGQISVLSLTLTNPNTLTDLTGVAFTDPLPGGMLVADPPNAITNGCGDPTFAPVAGAAALDFSAGSIPAGGVCTIQVDLQGVAEGDWANTTDPVSSSEGGTGASSNPAVLTVEHPALTLEKTISSGSPYAAVDDTIAYQYLLTNTGNVTLIGAGAGDLFTISDDQLGELTCPPTPTGLAPDATLTCTASHTVTQADLNAGSITNVAVAHARYGSLPVDSNSATVTASADQRPALTLVKDLTAGEPFARVGDTLTYRYTLTNTGNVTIAGVDPDGLFTISDDRIGDPLGTAFNCGALTQLAPAESVTCTAAYTVTQADLDAGAVTNTAAGFARLGDDPVRSNDATFTASADQNSQLALQKVIVSGDLFSQPGDEIVYRYTLTNTGNVTLTGDGPDGLFTITDDHLGDPLGSAFTCGSGISLAPGESLTCTASYFVTPDDLENRSVTNQAAGHALSGADPVTSPIATVTANVERSMLTGQVFHDLDQDGSRQDGEAAIAGVTLDLYDENGDRVASTVTADDGAYRFLNLLPGSYRVVERDPLGYFSTTANTVPVTVTPGGTAQADFGDTLIAGSSTNNIHGVVYLDANHNGLRDSGEAPLPGTLVTLYNALGGVVDTARANADGKYAFTALPPGLYTVVETNPAEHLSTTLDRVAVALTAHTAAQVDYGDRTAMVGLVDPAVTKYGSPTSAKVGDTVIYTLTIGNNGDTPAEGVVLTDTLPRFLDLIHAEVDPDRGLPLVRSGRTLTLTIGTLAPGESYTLTLLTRVNRLGKAPGGDNVTTLQSSSTQPAFNDRAAARLEIFALPIADELPQTGFAPGRMTALPAQPTWAADPDQEMIIRIPTLGLETSVVGVPVDQDAWDVSWLGDRLGYLEGTAYPTWPGNSVLTGHVYGADGLPGPLVDLHTLKWGDRIIISASGQESVYEVRSVYTTGPLDPSVFRHEDRPWLTLVTCQGYDQRAGDYRYRLVVRAVLVEVR